MMSIHSRRNVNPSKAFLIFTYFIARTIPAFSQSDPYFQQRVSYDIQVTLDINHNILVGHEKLTYTNNSPDTLTSVWFHLYPNAYKDERSVFAKEMLERGINDFFYTEESNRGSMTLQNVQTDTIPLRWQYKEGDETGIQVFLPHGLVPGDSRDFSMNFTVKIPRLLSRLGHNNYHYEITQWYPKIAVYDSKGWHSDGYHLLGEFYGDFGTFNVAITLPENMWVAATGTLTSAVEKIGWIECWSSASNLMYYLNKNSRNNWIL